MPRALLLLMILLTSSCAAPKTISMACDNPSNPKDSPSFVIDNVNSRIDGATRVWKFDERTIEWQDTLGYTYSLDRESGQMHRVYPRFNMGYMFDCHPTGRTY